MILLLVIIDIYLRIQRLNFRVFNIDSKIQQLIDRFDPDNKSKQLENKVELVDENDEDTIYNNINHQQQEAEFSYY